MFACGSISVIVPVFNERDSLVELHGELCRVLAALGCPHEIILVDDGSTDGSLSVLRTIQSSDVHVVVVELRRNFGKATALQAGFQFAKGDVVITMDGDLQDDPNEIPRFLEMLEDGFDLVSGWKKSRQDPLTKTVPSRLFNFATSLLTGIPLRDFNCGFKAYRREVVERLDLYGELHRYIPVLAHAKGFRVGEIPVRHHARRYGESKYSFERFLRGAFDLLTVLFLSRFRRRPLHLFGLLGISVTFVGFAIDFYLTVLWFMGERPIGDRPLLALGTLMITVGIQMLVFGLMAEMFTAVTYRRSDVMELVRQVDRHQCVTEHGASETSPRDIAVGQGVGHDV
jgi:glycosyltransferase involved in cell wall biosynthesis